MGWFLLLLPLIMLYILTAFFGRWPVESLWILAVIAIGPTLMFVRETFPVAIKSLHMKMNLIYYLQKSLNTKNAKIKKLTDEVQELNQELAGLHKMMVGGKETSAIQVAKSLIQTRAEKKTIPLEQLAEMPYQVTKNLFSNHPMTNYDIMSDKSNEVLTSTVKFNLPPKPKSQADISHEERKSEAVTTAGLEFQPDRESNYSEQDIDENSADILPC